jgi:hypothetical protein
MRARHVDDAARLPRTFVSSDAIGGGVQGLRVERGEGRHCCVRLLKQPATPQPTTRVFSSQSEVGYKNSRLRNFLRQQVSIPIAITLILTIIRNQISVL